MARRVGGALSDPLEVGPGSIQATVVEITDLMSKTALKAGAAGGGKGGGEGLQKFQKDMLVLAFSAHPLPHPGVELRANFKPISHRCHLFEAAFVWELIKETIDLFLGCLQGGVGHDLDGGDEWGFLMSEVPL